MWCRCKKKKQKGVTCAFVGDVQSGGIFGHVCGLRISPAYYSCPSTKILSFSFTNIYIFIFSNHRHSRQPKSIYVRGANHLHMSKRVSVGVYNFFLGIGNLLEHLISFKLGVLGIGDENRQSVEDVLVLRCFMFEYK